MLCFFFLDVIKTKNENFWPYTILQNAFNILGRIIHT